MKIGIVFVFFILCFRILYKYVIFRFVVSYVVEIMFGKNGFFFGINKIVFGFYKVFKWIVLGENFRDKG